MRWSMLKQIKVSFLVYKNASRWGSTWQQLYESTRADIYPWTTGKKEEEQKCFQKLS